MSEIISLDGVQFKLEAPDIDGDGEVGGVEKVTQRFGRQGETEVIQPTELGESLRELNQDNIELTTRMSGIDMRSRLHYAETGSILAIDSLVAFKFLPGSVLHFTRQKKRLAVSLGGKGREEIVEVVAGKKEQDAKNSMSLFDKAKGMMGGGK